MTFIRKPITKRGLQHKNLEAIFDDMISRHLQNKISHGT